MGGWRRAAAVALVWMAQAQAQDPAAVRYISDETAITLRDNKGMDAAVAGLLTSGTRVELLESDSSSGYARVRVAPGREGWVLARYLSETPAARERLVQVEAMLAGQQALVRKLEAENAGLRATARSAPTSASAVPSVAASAAPPADQPSRLTGMLTGAGLVVAGLLTGLLLPLLRRNGNRRHWTQL